MSDVERLQNRADRERRARKQAEALIEEKSRQLYQANQQLAQFNQQLGQRVEEATAELRANNEQLRRRVRELAAINSVATALTSVIELQPLLERMLESAKEVVNGEAASLLLCDCESGPLRFRVVKGSGAEVVQNLTVAMGQGITGQVALTRRPVLVQDAYQDPRFDRSYDARTGVTTKSLLAVPIEMKGNLVGVLEVINKVGDEVFDEYDLRLFESFASSAGVAIENARLFQQTLDMANDLREALEKERWLSIEKEKMGAYISKSVRDEISRNREQKLALGGKTARITVLFSDIVGFTRISENLEPHRVVRFLNQHMTAMTEAIEAHGGVVDKFIGDGIMAVFTDTIDGVHHALRAARAGIAMQLRLMELRRSWETDDPELGNLAMRVGINTGEVVAGNIGAETRMDYTVVGDNVNVASRIESVAEPGAVYVSQSTFDQIHEQIHATRMKPIQVKNRSQPVQTYSLRIAPPGLGSS